MTRESILNELATLEARVAFFESRVKLHRNRIDELNQQLADLDVGAVREREPTAAELAPKNGWQRAPEQRYDVDDSRRDPYSINIDNGVMRRAYVTGDGGE